MNNRSFDDKYFDDMLNRVLLDIEGEDIKKSEEILLEFEGKPAFKTSFRHRWHMKRMIRKFEKESETNTRARPVGRILVTAAVAIAVVISTSVFVNADLARFFQWLGFYSAEYVDITLSKDYTQVLMEETATWQHGKIYVPGLIPDGYVFNRITMYYNMIEIKYESSDGSYLRYRLKLLGDNVIISSDNKDTNVKKIKVNGYEAIYFSNDYVNILQYNTNEYIYELNSDVLTEKELKKIAENLESLEKLVVN